MTIFSKSRVACAWTIVLIFHCASHVPSAQEVVANEGAFRQATSAQKRKTLNEVAAHRLVVPPRELHALLRAGLEDSEPEIKAHALSALGTRAQFERFRPAEEMRIRWNVERQALIGLRDAVLQALADSHEVVRRDAIFALISLDYEAGGSRERFMSADTVHRLVETFGRDPSGAIRGRIMNELALSGDTSPLTSQLFVSALDISALDDQSASIVAHAARGLANAKRVEALPRLVQLLTHPNANVRLTVSQTVAAYRELAVPYLPQVDEAAQGERDPIIKKTLEGARSVLMQARAAQTRPK